MTRKWNPANDNWKSNDGVGNEITCNTEVLRSSLCDCNNAYILVRGDVTATAADATKVVFENFVPLTECFTKIDAATIDDA